MSVYDLIFMACLSLGPSAQCKDEMVACVTEKRDAAIAAFLKKHDFKKMTADQYMSGQPVMDWSSWALDCAGKKKAEMGKPIPYPVVSASPEASSKAK